MKNQSKKSSKKTKGPKAAREARARATDGIPPEMLKQFPELGELADQIPPGAVVVGGIVIGFVRAHLDLLGRQTIALETIATCLQKQVDTEGTTVN